jgi:hypothetical protein
LEAKLIGLFIFGATALTLSLASGNTFLGYESANRDTQPIKYWIAVGLLAVITLTTGGFGLWGLFRPWP